MESLNDASEPQREDLIETCDICIVGAGIAGLNAAAVASQYLSRDQKIVLVDRRPRSGGMWVDTYPYVRLHQPHPLFTAGNIEWTLDEDRSHLATKSEVLDHFDHCIDVIEQRVSLVEYYGWTVDDHVESESGNRLTAKSISGQRLTIQAQRVIKASGLEINPKQPLQVSSSRIHSVSPDYFDFRGHDMRGSRAPIWIVGGGKTAMDTAHLAVTEYPGREVNIIAGQGTYFIDRDKLVPNGTRRLLSGTLPTRLFNTAALRFDGTNEDDVREWFQSDYAVQPVRPSRQFFNGLLSKSEAEAISSKVSTVDMEYFEDAIDHPDGIELRYRSGRTRHIPPGSWLVNCSGYIFRDNSAYEPYVSSRGTAVSINTRSVTIGFSSFAGYFLTHLLLLGKLDEVPLYELDAEDLTRKAKETLVWTALALNQHNLSVIFDAVPQKVFQDCGLNFDRWYPVHRRMIGTLAFLRTHHRDREHHRKTLDTVRERFDVRCGPLQR
ncbi:FAD-dependent oxidoreductase [Rhodococcoides kyotonense]|uniref:Pyridine nucleotide-disulphide oxidoreductase n=1 Tax=Rhodococcoides kyotonense TaxID=398843 RepID=A0A239LHG8_9NOCA|nr:FAD-dependent oxidoreductase [Rhodococcus kyotonensis]SNT29283.1 Pyridine nucleotide-disulphide oxidoreductase [Rhodococcus kyotonensis]